VSVKKQRDIIEVGDLSFIKYIDAQEIEKKVQEIADSIREDYHEKYPMFLVVMNGAFIYAADLIRKLDL
jgi:hypoxanthine phosphoribosyltransferase